MIELMIELHQLFLKKAKLELCNDVGYRGNGTTNNNSQTSYGNLCYWDIIGVHGFR